MNGFIESLRGLVTRSEQCALAHKALSEAFVNDGRVKAALASMGLKVPCKPRVNRGSRKHPRWEDCTLGHGPGQCAHTSMQPAPLAGMPRGFTSGGQWRYVVERIGSYTAPPQGSRSEQHEDDLACKLRAVERAKAHVDDMGNLEATGKNAAIQDANRVAHARDVLETARRSVLVVAPPTIRRVHGRAPNGKRITSVPLPRRGEDCTLGHSEGQCAHMSMQPEPLPR